MTRHLNQSLLFPQARMDQMAVGIIGTGAIGSFVAMALAKMGIKNIMTWDHDKIEEHNIANQIFPVDSVGKRKAIATREMVKQFSGEDICTTAIKITGAKAYRALSDAFPNHRLCLILAVDSLDVRRAIVEDLRQAWGTQVIDARMGAKTYRVMTFAPTQARELTDYLATLTSDADAVQERCGQKSIIYTVLGVAAEVCAFVHAYAMEDTFGADWAPAPVVFDYGTGIRMQRTRPQGEVLDFTGDDLAEAGLTTPVPHHAEAAPF